MVVEAESGHARRSGFAKRSTEIKIASTAGTHADAEHIQTADDAADEAERIFNQKHHTSAPLFTEEPMGRIAQCLNSSRFESILSVVICLNMILIIVETDLTADGQDPPVWITTANITFLAVYFVECVLKICVFRSKYFQDHWNWLDLSVVLSDIVLTSLDFLDGVERISVMRIFRLVKLSRAVRVIRQIWELKILLLGFKAAAKSIFFGMGMVLVMTMVWAILAVQLLHPVNSEIWGSSTECERCQRAFSSVWNACITIFQTVIAGDSWGLLAIPLIESQWWTSLWFLVVLVTVQLAMLNLILAVIVERAADARDKEEKHAIVEQEESMHKSKLRLIQLCRELDTDDNGRLSEEEFLEGFENNPEFAGALLGMGVYPEDIGLLFEVLDTQGSGEISYVSFVNTLARLRTQMTQVILYSITELRKTVAQMQVDLKTGVHRPELKSPTVTDSENVERSIDSPDLGIDKILARQMEEMSKEMQSRFQQMHLEISTSFHNALQISVEAKGVESQLHAMMRTVDSVANNVAAADQSGASSWRKLFSGGNLASNIGPTTPVLPTTQMGSTPVAGLCCAPAALSAREMMPESHAPAPAAVQPVQGRPV